MIRTEVSFTRLSPSNIGVREEFTASPFVILIVPTASDGKTVAPSTKAVGQLNSGRRECTNMAVIIVVNMTNPIASKEMGRMFFLKLCQDISQAASNNSGGSVTKKIRSGSRHTDGYRDIQLSNRAPPTKITGSRNLILLFKADNRISVSVRNIIF
jgi:hypothetical protein